MHFVHHSFTFTSEVKSDDFVLTAKLNSVECVTVRHSTKKKLNPAHCMLWWKPAVTVFYCKTSTCCIDFNSGQFGCQADFTWKLFTWTVFMIIMKWCRYFCQSSVRRVKKSRSRCDPGALVCPPLPKRYNTFHITWSSIACVLTACKSYYVMSVFMTITSKARTCAHFLPRLNIHLAKFYQRDVRCVCSFTPSVNLCCVYDSTVSVTLPLVLFKMPTASSCVTPSRVWPLTAMIWSPLFSRPSSAAAPWLHRSTLRWVGVDGVLNFSKCEVWSTTCLSEHCFDIDG